MITKLSGFFTKALKRYISMDDSVDESDIYQYGFEITISSIFNMLVVLVLGTVFNSIFSGVIFVFEFYLVRRYTGGYHADNYYTCNIVFGLTYLFVAIISKLSNKYHFIAITTILIVLSGIGIIWRLSPVPNKHKKITEEQKTKIHKAAIIRYSAVFLLGCLTLKYSIFYGEVVLSTLVAIVILILVASVQNKEVC